jgi:uncharacterized protein (TIGR03437 family)
MRMRGCGQLRRSARTLALAAISWAVTAAPFGRVVAIGGQASDLALDEARGVLYVANFTANRIDVISLASASLLRSLNVSPQPYAAALSPDRRWLVVAHYGNFAAPAAPRNALTLIDLESSARQSFVLSSPPLSAAFGIDGLALIVTAREFLLFNPVTGGIETLGTLAEFAANTLPRPPGAFPANAVAVATGVSGDGRWIYCLAENYRFRYDVVNRRMLVLGYTASPPMGPRAVSVNHDGTFYTGGWALFDRQGVNVSQFPNASGLLHVGSHAIDSRKGVIYSQIPEGDGLNATNLPPPVLRVLSAKNLAVRETLELAENLAGRSILDAEGRMMYAVSESGVMFLPVGELERLRRVTADREELILRAASCGASVLRGQIRITDLSGAQTPFSLSAPNGVRFSAAAGVTPATVEVSVDPEAATANPGTTELEITITARDSVRIPRPVRLLIHRREPDQRGTTVHVPGRLVDILADPLRDRFYVLRQDQNQVLVFDGSSHQLIRALDTANTPTQMAITFDGQRLLVGHDNAQIATVYDLDTLDEEMPVRFPGGHYPRSIAASGRAILAAARVAGPKHKVDIVDLGSRRAVEPPALGVWENDIHIDTVLAASPNGAWILLAQADGNLMLYDASSDAFVISRRNAETLAGGYGASSYGDFAVGNAILNASLVPVRQFGGGPVAAGYAFAGESAFRFTPPGSMERIAAGATLRPVRTADNPASPPAGFSFTRSVAVLASRQKLVLLTRSGFTVLPWAYDAAAIPPRITHIGNAADGQPRLAPGSLVSLFGSDLSPVSAANPEMPISNALSESCLTVNGFPAPVFFVSPSQINAQIPYFVEGLVSLVLRTPGGVSDTFRVTLRPAAPGVFQIPVPQTPLTAPAVYNARNGGLATGSNPVKRGDRIAIFVTGLGRTSPPVEAGVPAPVDPPAESVLRPEVRLGGHSLPIRFSGLTPGGVGVYQIQAEVLRSVPTGMAIPLEIIAGGSEVSVPVRVIE